jgi:hypothetical protein
MKRRLFAATALAAAVLAPTASAGGSLTVNPAAPTVSSGVFFTVSGKSVGNRDFLVVDVSCSSGGAEVYATRIYVALDASGNGTSETIHPPASSCTATLEAAQSIDRFKAISTTPFTVT